MEYLDGDRVARDRALAMTLFVAACEGGDAEGCWQAAIQVRLRSSGDDARERERELVVASCEGGHAEACNWAGLLYAANGAKSTPLYIAACIGGFTNGCVSAGRNYASGRGVDQDYVRAASLFVSGCLGGHANGCFLAGRLHATGTGVTEDQILAEALFNEACALVADAQEEEGIRFITRWGVNIGIPLVRACEADFDQAYADEAD